MIRDGTRKTVFISVPGGDAVFERFCLDPAQRLLVYATPPPNRAVLGGGYHVGVEVARWLAEHVEEGTFGRGVQLVIRPHPKYGRDGFIEETDFSHSSSAIQAPTSTAPR